MIATVFLRKQHSEYYSNTTAYYLRWIPRLIAHLEKKLFWIPDFLIAFGSPIDTNIMDIFGFERGPPRWAWQPLKVLQFFKKSWRCTTLDDRILWSTWPIWSIVCLLERSDSLLLGKNMEFGIYCLVPTLGRGQYLVDCNFLWQPRPKRSLWGM